MQWCCAVYNSYFIIIIIVFNVRKTFSISVNYTENDRIVSGVPVEIDLFPHQVSLEVTFTHSCGGSIIHPSIVITAAHCLAHINNRQRVFPSELLVRAGISISGRGGTVHFVRSVEIAPNYQDQQNTDSNDLGLVYLLVDIPISRKSQPIKMSAVTPEAGEMAWVTGFGSQEIEKMNPKVLKQHLMAVQIPIFAKDKCFDIMYAKGELVATDMLCAGYNTGHEDSCKGDSGGPMVVEDRLVGITAWGIGCGQLGVPGVYTDVAYHLNWIWQCSHDLLRGKNCNYSRNRYN